MFRSLAGSGFVETISDTYPADPQDPDPQHTDKNPGLCADLGEFIRQGNFETDKNY